MAGFEQRLVPRPGDKSVLIEIHTPMRGPQRGRPVPAVDRLQRNDRFVVPSRPGRLPGADPEGRPPSRTRHQTNRRSEAHLDNSYRLDFWVLRSTLETWVSTVLIEMNSCEAISL